MSNYLNIANDENETKKKWGFVYIIGNIAMPNLYKIGYTTRKPLIRAHELNIHSGSGMPGKYKVLFEKRTMSPQVLEKNVHQLLKEYRYSKEWFKCSNIDVCVKAIEKAYQELNENSDFSIDNFIENEERERRNKIEQAKEKKVFEDLRSIYESQLDEYETLFAQISNESRQRNNLDTHFLIDDPIATIGIKVVIMINFLGLIDSLVKNHNKKLTMFFVIFIILSFLLLQLWKRNKEKYFETLDKRKGNYSSDIYNSSELKTQYKIVMQTLTEFREKYGFPTGELSKSGNFRYISKDHFSDYKRGTSQ